MRRAAWTAALRIARRDARRDLGRSILIALMVGLPVLGISAGAVLIHSNSLTAEDWTRSRMGSADLVLEGPRAEAVRALANLPREVRSVEIRQTNGRKIADGKIHWFSITETALDDPLLDGHLTLLDGRAPEREGQAALSPGLMRAFGAGIGDRVDLRGAEATVTVTGTVVRPYECSASGCKGDEVAVVAPGTFESAGMAYQGDSSYDRWFLDAGSIDPEEVAGMLTRGAQDLIAGGSVEADLYAMTRTEAMSEEPPAPGETVGMVFVLGGLALFEAGLMAAAAFAVGARRQLHSLGLVAAVGGERRDLSRIVLGTGIVLGSIGGILGVLLGIGLAGALMPFLGEITGRIHQEFRVPGLQLAAAACLGLLTGSAAAWFPARTAARVPTREALAGRRPIRSGQRSVTVLGLGGVGVGGLIAGLGAKPPASEWQILLGAIVVVSGFTACSPALIALLARPAGRAPMSMRLALRDAARHRTRTGPAAAAIMAALSLPIALSMFALSTVERDRAAFVPTLGEDQALIDGSDPEGRSYELQPSAISDLEEVVPGATTAPLMVAAQRGVDGNDPANIWFAPQIDASGEFLASELAVGGRDLLVALGVDKAPQAFARGEVIEVGPGAPGRTAREWAFSGAQGGVHRLTAVGADSPEAGSLPRLVVSPQGARELGFVTVPRGWLFRSTQPLTAEERLRIEGAIAGESPSVWVTFAAQPPGDDEALRNLALGVAALLALAIVAIATALNVAEARDDLATLGAVGASPRIRRALTAWQAGTLASAGAVMAVPAGLVPALAVLVARGGEYPLVWPWAAMGVVLFVVPLLAASAAALLTRSRIDLRRHL